MVEPRRTSTRAVATALRGALTARGTPPLVMCHVSHLYPSGASLYFTFMARQEPGAEIEQWQAAKTAACDAIVANGGTITHHHAIGTDHARWMRSEVGDARTGGAAGDEGDAGSRRDHESGQAARRRVVRRTPG